MSKPKQRKRITKDLESNNHSFGIISAHQRNKTIGFNAKNSLLLRAFLTKKKFSVLMIKGSQTRNSQPEGGKFQKSYFLFSKFGSTESTDLITTLVKAGHKFKQTSFLFKDHAKQAVIYKATEPDNFGPLEEISIDGSMLDPNNMEKIILILSGEDFFISSMTDMPPPSGMLGHLALSRILAKWSDWNKDA